MNLKETKRPFYRKPAFIASMSAGVAALAIAGGLTGCASSSNLPEDLVLALPKADEKVEVPDDLSTSNISYGALKLTDGALDEMSENGVVSPIGLSMAVSGVALASGNSSKMISSLGYDNDSFVSTFNSLMEALNWSHMTEQEEEGGGRYDSRLASMILYQIVDDGSTLVFNDDYRETIANSYCSTLKSGFGSWKEDASKAIQEGVGQKLDIPVFDVGSPSALTYSAMYLKDSFYSGSIGYTENIFHAPSDDMNVKSRRLSPLGLYDYYETDDYQALKVDIEETSLIYFVPKDGHELNEIQLSQAYKDFSEKNYEVRAEGWVPYFEAESESNFTKAISPLFVGLDDMSKLIINNSDGNLQFGGCLQTAHFVCDENGVEGSQVTVIIDTGSANEPDDEYEHVEFKADKPFYVISDYDGLPLFAMKIFMPTVA